MREKPDFKPGQKVDGYILEEYLGGGQDGEVWRVKRGSPGKTFAAKFLNNIEEEDKKRRFAREVYILSSVNHPHVIGISDQGEAWNPTSGKIVPFYIMEYFEACSLDQALMKIPSEDRLKSYCSLFQQVASALEEVHGKGMTHGDIKASNLMVHPRVVHAKLTDFGFGRPPGESPEARREYPGSSYHTPPGLSPQEADIYRLGKTFIDSLAVIRPDLNSGEASAIEEALAALCENPSLLSLQSVKSQLETIRELRTRGMPSYDEEIRVLVPEVSGTAKGTLLRDPIHGGLRLTRRCMALLDLPQFQRLRHIKGLPSCELVYPSISHSCFERTLGQYAQTVAYLRKLTSLPELRPFLTPVHVRAAILLSVINQIGDYPFSAEMLRAMRMADINRSSLSPGARAASMVSKEPIAKIICDEWGLDPAVMGSLLKSPFTPEVQEKWSLVLSILDGPLSAPRLDYVLRVLSKAGVPHAFDAQEFIQSLRVTPGGETLAVSVEGLRRVEDFLLLSFKVTEQVIFHKTVRAADAMLVHALADLLVAGFDFDLLLDAGEAEFLKGCMQAAQSKDLSGAERLLESYLERRLFKVVAEWSASELPDRVKKTILIHSAEYASRDLSQMLEAGVSRETGRVLPPRSIIVDAANPIVSIGLNPIYVVTPNGAKEMRDMSPQFMNLLEDTSSGVFGKVRIFASPDVVEQTKRLGRERMMNILRRL